MYWRRSLRGKFNSPEGAELARQNSAVLAKGREQERISRKSKAPTTSTVATPTPTPEEAAAVAAYVAVAEGGDEKAAELAAAKALIEAAEAEGADAKEPLLVRTTTRVAQGAQQPAPEPLARRYVRLSPLRPLPPRPSHWPAAIGLLPQHHLLSPSLTISHHLSPSLFVAFVPCVVAGAVRLSRKVSQFVSSPPPTPTADESASKSADVPGSKMKRTASGSMAVFSSGDPGAALTKGGGDPM